MWARTSFPCWSRPATRWSMSAAAKHKPYTPHEARSRVETVTINRDAEEAAGTFGARIAGAQA